MIKIHGHKLIPNTPYANHNKIKQTCIIFSSHQYQVVIFVIYLPHTNKMHYHSQIAMAVSNPLGNQSHHTN